MISLLTCTHNRPQFFPILEYCIQKQTYKGEIEWIVVCDTDLTPYKFTAGQRVFYRDPSKDNPNIHSLCHNMIYGLNQISESSSACLCVEDDDIFFENYIATYVHMLQFYDMCGCSPAFYFHLSNKSWRNLGNQHHASLAATGFTRAVFPVVKRIASNPYLGRASAFVDQRLWCHWRDTLKKSSVLIRNDFFRPLQVGIKGHGQGGIGRGHEPIGHPDPEGRVYKKWRLDEFLSKTTG